MNYREVTAALLPQIVFLNEKIFAGLYASAPYTLQDYRKRLEGVSPAIFVAEEEGEIVGNAIAFQKEGALYLWVLGVDPRYRKRGIAEHLYQMCEDRAREIGCKKVTVKIYNVSQDMIRLALKRGYIIVDIEKNVNPQHHALFLELPL